LAAEVEVKMANPLICVFNPVTSYIDEIPAASTGPAAPGTPVVTNSNGLLDPSLLGQGVIATAGQNLSTGQLVGLYSQSSVLHMQLAYAADGGTAPSGATYPVAAAGFVSNQIFSGFTGIVSFSGTFVYIDGNSEFSATDIGTIVFLSGITPGGVTKTPPSVTLTLTSVAMSVGSTAVYTGTITGGSANAYAGYSVTVTGFANAPNNGTFLCTASSGVTLTLSNSTAVAESAPATAVVQLFTQSVGFVVGFALPNKVTIAFSPAFLDFTQINGILPVAKGGTGASTAPQALDNLFGYIPAAEFWAGPISGLAANPTARFIVNTDLAHAVFGASGGSHEPGAVPDPGSVAGTTRYLREDATWHVIPLPLPFDYPGQTASLAAVTMITPAVTGMYRVSVYEECTVAGASGGGSPFGSGVFGSGTFNILDDNVQTVVSWTDDVGLRTTTPIPTPLDLGSTNAASGDVFIRAVSGQPVTFQTFLANTGSPTYGVFVRLETL
jgi:hypothetical protein